MKQSVGLKMFRTRSCRKLHGTRFSIQLNLFLCFFADSVNIKILNAGAWSRASERIPVSLPTEVITFVFVFLITFIYIAFLYAIPGTNERENDFKEHGFRVEARGGGMIKLSALILVNIDNYFCYF